MTAPESLVAQVELLRPGIRAVILDRVADADLAEDLTQDVMESALRHLGELRDPAALALWLRRMAINRCWQYYRRPVVAAPVKLAEPSSYHAAVRRLMLREVLAALRELPERNRLALLMHVLDDMPYAAIATFLDVPLSTVESRIHRARAQLRRQVGHWLDCLAEPATEELA